MESRFAHDFSHVRVHADAVGAARWNARAFTSNHDIHIGDRYDASSLIGQALLAHELTHVVQADIANGDRSLPPSSIEALENEARAVATALRTGAALPPVMGVARGLATPLRDDEPPTFGNLPQDDPLPSGSRRLRLVERNGKWVEIAPGRTPETRTARGNYDFVILPGSDTVWAVKSGGRLGHTEAARGGRVVWAGLITFSNKGALKEWTNASGHHLPAGRFAKNAGLPMERYVQPSAVPFRGQREISRDRNCPSFNNDKLPHPANPQRFPPRSPRRPSADAKDRIGDACVSRRAAHKRSRAVHVRSQGRS